MRAFIDIGAYSGDTLEIAINKLYPEYDRFYGFEPFKICFDILKKKFDHDGRFRLYNLAIDTETITNKKLYLPSGIDNNYLKSISASLLDSKNNIDLDKFVMVDTIDFTKFLLDNFDSSDELVLKMNAEGIEYAVFEKMIQQNVFEKLFFKTVYCEWHYGKIGMPEKQHNNFLMSMPKVNFCSMEAFETR